MSTWKIGPAADGYQRPIHQWLMEGVVKTHGASSITTSEATLNGEVTGIGDGLAEQGFCFDEAPNTTPSHTDGSTCVEVSSVSTTEEQFSVTVDGLDTNATYQARAFVLPDTSGADYQYGNTATWTTDTGETGCDSNAELFSGGKGFESDPFRICNAADLIEVGERNLHNAHYEVFNDINMNLASKLNPIGDGDGTFDGHFDGNGHIIANLTVDEPSRNDVGMFGRISSEGTITDIRLDSPEVVGSTRTGAIVGRNDGTVQDIEIRHPTVEGDESTGGAIGRNYATVERVETTDVDVVGGRFSGGFAGRNSGTITESRATGNIETNSNDAGGFVGYQRYGTIVRSHAEVDVYSSGSSYVAGFVGYSRDATIEEAYATGRVEVDNISNYVAGLVGRERSGDIIDSYASGFVPGNSATGDVGGLTARGNSTDSHWDASTTFQHYSSSGTALTYQSFDEPGTFSNWDFLSTYSIGPTADGYQRPIHQWLLEGPVETRAASSITTSEATLNGEVTDVGGGLAAQGLLLRRKTQHHPVARRRLHVRRGLVGFDDRRAVLGDRQRSRYQYDLSSPGVRAAGYEWGRLPVWQHGDLDDRHRGDGL